MVRLDINLCPAFSSHRSHLIVLFSSHSPSQATQQSASQDVFAFFGTWESAHFNLHSDCPMERPALEEMAKVCTLPLVHLTYPYPSLYLTGDV